MALKPIWNYISNKYKLKVPSRIWTWEGISLCLLLIHLSYSLTISFSHTRTGKQPSTKFFICLIWQSIWTMQKSRFRILHRCNEKSMLLSSFSTLPYTFNHQANKKCILYAFCSLSTRLCKPFHQPIHKHHIHAPNPKLLFKTHIGLITKHLFIIEKDLQLSSLPTGFGVYLRVKRQSRLTIHMFTKYVNYQFASTLLFQIDWKRIQDFLINFKLDQY